MTNLLMAGNLYKAHKIDKGIQKLGEIQKQAAIQQQKQNMQAMQQKESHHRENMAKQDTANKLAAAQLSIQLNKQQQEARTKLLRNTFFEISSEIDDVFNEKKLTSLEKYFRYGSINATIQKSEIDTDISDDLTEKKFIRDTFKKVENEINNAEKKFTKQEKKDLADIYKLLEVDEESEISKLKTSELLNLSEKEKKLKAWYEKAKKIAGGAGLIYVLASQKKGSAVSENKSNARMNEKLILPNHFKDNSKSKQILDEMGIESLNSILGPTIFEIWYNHKFKDFYSDLGFWEKGNFDILIEKTLKLQNKIGFFGKLTKASELLEKWGKSLPKQTKKLNEYCKKAFNNPFPKALYKKEKEIEEKKDTVDKKITSLKKNIEDEKQIAARIIKKHPFVKTIITNRT